MLLDARKERFEIGVIDGKTVAFTNMRLDRKTIPDGIYCYDIRDSDRLNGTCAQIKPSVLVNHWGTILCYTEFSLDEFFSYYPNQDMEYTGRYVSLDEWLNLKEHPVSQAKN